MHGDSDSLFGDSDYEDPEQSSTEAATRGPRDAPAASQSLVLPTGGMSRIGYATPGASQRVGSSTLSASPNTLIEPPYSNLAIPRRGSSLPDRYTTNSEPGPSNHTRQSSRASDSLAKRPGTCAENPIIVEEADTIRPHPSKRSRDLPSRSTIQPRLPTKRALPLVVDPSVSAQDTFLQTLSHDRVLITLLIRLLNHLKGLSEAQLRERDQPPSKRQRLDFNGEPVSEEEWGRARTQELMAKFTIALKNAIQKATLVVEWKAARLEGRSMRTSGVVCPLSVDNLPQLQESIQSWLISKATGQPHDSSTPMTPSSSATSSMALPITPTSQANDPLSLYQLPTTMDLLFSGESDPLDAGGGSASWEALEQLFSSQPPWAPDFSNTVNQLPSDGLFGAELPNDIFGFENLAWLLEPQTSINSDGIDIESLSMLSTGKSNHGGAQSSSHTIDPFFKEFGTSTTFHSSFLELPLINSLPPHDSFPNALTADLLDRVPSKPVFDPTLIPPFVPPTAEAHLPEPMFPHVDLSQPLLPAEQLSSPAVDAHDCALESHQTLIPGNQDKGKGKEKAVESISPLDHVQPMELDVDPEVHDPSSTAPPVALPVPAGSRSQQPNTKWMSVLSRAEEHRADLVEALSQAMTELWGMGVEHAVLSGIVKGITRREVEAESRNFPFPLEDDDEQMEIDDVDDV